MYDTENQRSKPWLFGLIAMALLIGGGLVIGIGASEPGAVDQLPAAPVRGMSDPNASALAAGEEDRAGRPVLQVTAGLAGAAADSPSSAPAGGSTSTTASPAASVSTVAPASSTSTTALVVDPGLTSTTVAASESTTSSSALSSEPTTTMPPVTGPTSSTTGPSGGALTAVELELARLTNELRTNPNGPLRREGAVINCDGRIPIDPATGLYQPVGGLSIDATASIEVARDWSSQLTTNLQHRPQAGIGALQGAGIDVAAAGENIAYHNFPDTAMRHFVGWRESDGHFCNMMDPTFTRLGVGEITRPDGFSFATQNFFSVRSEG